MEMYQYELFRREDGNKGEILKTPTGYLVKKYCDFCVLYFAKRFKSYAVARDTLIADGFTKAKPV